MEILYTNKEYVQELYGIMKNFSTYYAWGAFGAPANSKNRKRYDVPDTVSPSTFLFDCSGFAYKALPWGWCGDKNKTYGGATYQKYDLDHPFDQVCTDITSDFSHILPGEVVYMTGHVGVYCGAGVVIECTAAWENQVLLSECSNTGINTGLKHKRKWLKHGKLPFIKYEEAAPQYTTAGLGEGLIRIARRCGITLEEIKRLNPEIKGPMYLVRIGQKVRIR